MANSNDNSGKGPTKPAPDAAPKKPTALIDLKATEVDIRDPNADQKRQDQKAEPAAPASDGSLLVLGAPDFDRGTGHEASPIVAALVRATPDPCAGGTPRTLASLPGSGAEAEAVDGQVAEVHRSAV